ncbi:hypothetical protein [Bordetella bronchiseptica]|uniref:hypothetical protein n=1 Tax=Bordetella bronchiseptica TaxID=518 RepID=UPI000A4E46B0|nr:hypothetical protein [Bordetella bronchiseptica]
MPPSEPIRRLSVHGLTLTPEQFAIRMRQRHGEQLMRYCAQVTALDGRPARAALYFPRARAWIDL